MQTIGLQISTIKLYLIVVYKNVKFIPGLLHSFYQKHEEP